MNTSRYNDYAKLFGEVVSLESTLSNSRRSLNDLREIIKEEDGDGSVGLIFSSHAVDQIQERLEILSRESSIIYEDVFNTEDPSKSIIWPSNTRAFIFGMMAKAAENESVQTEPSRSTKDGKEYHYKIEIKKWSTNEKKLVFVGIVENNTIKTAYFNWV
jgi:hypothetical protein